MEKCTGGKIRISKGLICKCAHHFSVATLGLLLIIFSSLNAQAFGVPDGFADPLLTKPPTLVFGPTLPNGDDIDCLSQIDLKQMLGLGEVIDLALCASPQIKQAWAAIKIQSGALGEAKSAYLPTLNATYSQQQTQVNYPQSTSSNTITNGHTSYLNGTWRLFDFGGRAANRLSSNLLLDAALASHDASIQRVMQAVIQAYFDVLSREASLKARIDAVKFAHASWDTTTRREVKGASSRSDSLQAQTALAQAGLASSRAQGEYLKAYASLLYVIGLPANTRLLLEPPKDYPEKIQSKDLAQWLEEAQRLHPAIKAAKAQWDSAKKKVTVARSAGMPTLDFVGNFYQNGYPNQAIQTTKSNTSTIGVTITIPIFEGFSTTYKIRGAQAQAEYAQAQMEDTELQILTEIVKSHADTVASLANLDFSEKLVRAATESLRSASNRYERGVADVLELLTSQNALAQAQEERIRCISEWQSARLRLMANAGGLGRLRERGVKPSGVNVGLISQ